MSKTQYNMIRFGQDVFLEGLDKYKLFKTLDWIHQRSKIIRTKRLAVVDIVHGIELILKAILLKKGYNIYKIRHNEIVLSNSKLGDLVNVERTVELDTVLSFYGKKYPDLNTEPLKKLAGLRNQIVHHGINIDEKKTEYFTGTIDYLIILYNREKIKGNFIKKISVLKAQLF